MATIVDPLGPREHFVRVGRWNLRVVEAGAGDPIVLVHGLGTSAATWRHNLDHLATCGRVLAVDLPGFGASDTPKNALCAEQLAQVLAAWCRTMAIDRAHFVGHSLGGEVGLWLAARHPELVASLTLAGSTGAPDAASLPVRFARLLWDGLREPASFMPVLLKAYWRAGPRRIYRTACASDPARLEFHLPFVSAPTCVLWGANDPVIRLSDARRLVAALPDARLVVVADGAHGLIFDAPEAFNRAVCDFLREQGAKAGPARSGTGRDEGVTPV